MQYVHTIGPPGHQRAIAGSRGGFTLIELLVAVFLSIVVIVVLLPAVSPRNRHPGGHRQLKDSTQVRGILQGMIIWAQNNQDDYPLPSNVDKNDTTVGTIGAAKDTSSNIFSLLIYNGFVPTEMFKSPAEVNRSIDVYEDYEFDAPSTAVVPNSALWDPAFHASPSAPFNIGTAANSADIGNNSYAHTAPVDARRPLWGATFVATEAAIANRGPGVIRVDQTPEGPVPVFDPDSNTLLIHGSRTRWEGNVGYNDNHVNFETRLGPEGLIYKTATGKERPDLIFFDEPDDPTGTNAYLGIWITAGDTRKDYTSWVD
jgi:type II secretory pathway pseudopilin PulG